MAFWTYILHCADRSYYTGHTDNLEHRIGQHQSGALRGYTFERRPVELVWAESFPTREEALANEIRIKSWSRKKKEALIAKDWDRLKLFSRAPGERHGASSLALGIVPRLHSGGAVEASFSAEPKTLIPPPVIVLVRPQLGANIGKAARAMLNFGLADMRLVTPRDGWPNPSAGPASAGADIVLENAQVFASVAEAVADCTHVYATTVRKRGLVKPVMTPEEAARTIVTEPGRSALLFGPERSGLDTDDATLARTILTVPINPEFGSLNLAQAVILVAYEWSKHQTLVQPTETELPPCARQEDLEGLVGHVEELLEETRYFFPPDRATATRRTLRSVLTKPAWNAQEVRTMRGVFSALGKKRPR